MGSFGRDGDAETAGGGRIVILADSITLAGNGEKLAANGRPEADLVRKAYSLEGGSGGYIYVKTFNQHSSNKLDEKSNISAKGGLGIGDHTGGSGGVIVFDQGFEIAASNVHANGGKADKDDFGDGCYNGGSGTIYYRQNDTLLVDNRGVNTTALTLLRVPNGKELVGDRKELAKKLSVRKGARVKIQGEHRDMTFDELSILDNSWFELS